MKTKSKWQPTKVKIGVPTDEKTGDDWCKSDQDGEKLLDCIKFWN